MGSLRSPCYPRIDAISGLRSALGQAIAHGTMSPPASRSTLADIGLARRDWMRPLLAVALLSILVVAALWVMDRERNRRADAALVAHVDTLAREIRAEERKLHEAVVNQRAVRGMTRAEVLAVKGEPRSVFKNDQLPESHRKRGAVETWAYPFGDGSETSSVLFGLDGRVIYSRDDGGFGP